MWPWKIVIRYAFYSFLALYTVLEVTESRDGMFQELGKVADKVKERKLAKAKKKLEDEEERRKARLADKQPLLEEARRRVLAKQQQKKHSRRHADLLMEEDEETDPFLPLVQARSVLQKILQEADGQDADAAEEANEVRAGEATGEQAPTKDPLSLPEDLNKQRGLLGRLMLASLLGDNEVKQHLSAGRVLHSDLAAAAADWAQMLDDKEVEQKIEELRAEMAEAAA